MNRIRSTPWLLLLVGSGFLILTAWSVYRASQDTSAIINRDYYSHGLLHNNTLLEQQVVEAAGWSTQVALQHNQISVFLRDSDQRPVRRAEGVLTLLKTGKYHALQLRLEEKTPGEYMVQLPADLHGEVTADISLERKEARLSKRILLSLN